MVFLLQNWFGRRKGSEEEEELAPKKTFSIWWDQFWKTKRNIYYVQSFTYVRVCFIILQLCNDTLIETTPQNTTKNCFGFFLCHFLSWIKNIKKLIRLFIKKKNPNFNFFRSNAIPRTKKLFEQQKVNISDLFLR